MGESMIKEISAHELKGKLGSKEQLLLIDCREEDEWNSEHIEQAVLVPLSDFKNSLAKLEESGRVDLEKPIVVYCRSGKRSRQACENLICLNYKSVLTLKEGILGWMKEGLPVK